MNTQSSRQPAASSLPARKSFVLATASALAGAAVGVVAVVGWQSYDDNAARPVTSTNVQPGSGITSDAVQPSAREAAPWRNFDGRHGHVDSDPAVLLDFKAEPQPRPGPTYPESREGNRGHVSP